MKGYIIASYFWLICILINDAVQIENSNDDDDLSLSQNELHDQQSNIIPTSPPPSFHSRSSSPRRSSSIQTPIDTDVERSLDDAFGGSHESDNEDEEIENEETRRLVSHVDNLSRPDVGNRQMIDLPYTSPATSGSGRVYGGGSSTNDGVFANLSAKPTVGGDMDDEKPPVS